MRSATFLLSLALITDAQSAPKITHKVFFDIEIAGEKSERVVFGLFGETFPNTTEIFRTLCTGEKRADQPKKPMHYKGSVFYEVIPRFFLQGGNITNENETEDGSIFGLTPEVDISMVNHTGPGLLSMGKAPKFLVTTWKTEWLNGINIVFGKVMENYNFIEKIETFGSFTGGPTKKITIIDSGELPINEEL